LVEGPFDLYAVNRVFPTIAILGNQISQRQWLHLGFLIGEAALTNNTIRKILIWLDTGAQAEAYEIQKGLTRYVETEVLDVGGAKDPGSMTTQEITEVLHGYL